MKRAQEREILKLLPNGEGEIAAGKGYELDDVLAQADALLAKVSSSSLHRARGLNSCEL